MPYIIRLYSTIDGFDQHSSYFNQENGWQENDEKATLFQSVSIAEEKMIELSKSLTDKDIKKYISSSLQLLFFENENPTSFHCIKGINVYYCNIEDDKFVVYKSYK